MDWFAKSVRLAYFPSKDGPLPDRHTLLRRIGARSLSAGARLRLEWIIYYKTAGKLNARATASHFGISRKTFHKYLSRFVDQDLTTLEERSRAPKRTRKWEVTGEQESRVRALRQSHLKYGKQKLQVLYRTQHKENISTWKIERVVRKWQLYPEPGVLVKRAKKRAQVKTKVRIHQLKRQDKYNFLWQVDAIILWWYGARRVIFTAIEDLTKIGWARVYPNSTSTSAKDFLNRLVYLTDGELKVVHHDNGSEFAGGFSQACLELVLTQVYSRVRTPQDNASLERFNWTVQDEWLAMSEVGLDEIETANQDLTNWLVEYNLLRPHQTLAYQTPLEYAQKRFFPVLPMWSARTETCYHQLDNLD